MIQFLFYGSGGHGVVVAAEILADAAVKAGLVAQSFASYGAERRGGKVEGYVRISDKNIHLHSKMYNPDYIILMDESFWKSELLASLKEEGTVLINSPKSPESFSSFGKFKKVTVDATKIAREKDLRLPSGIPIINTVTLGALVALIPGLNFDCLADAIKERKIPNPVRNIGAAKEAYDQVKLQLAGAPILGEKEETAEIYPSTEQPMPAYRSKLPPCEANCPAGEPIQTTMSLIRENQFENALANIKAENPFPGICGRVCFHPCEAYCNRSDYDEGIAINMMERAVFDISTEKSVKKSIKKPKTGKKIAIIGSGPAGMSCAYFSSLLGHEVRVFEALPMLGGIPKIAIPRYRLPQNVVDKEIEEIVSNGIDVQTNVKVGKDVTFENILKDFDASFIAIGAHQSTRLNISGEDGPGVISGLSLLKDIGLGKKADLNLGTKVGVIGGGNTAVDSARTAKRLGVQEVSIIYRRSKEEMPAYRQEVIAAENEGITILSTTMPVKIHRYRKRIVKLECVRTKLGHLERDGRHRREPIEGSNFTVDLDTVIVAAGESPELSFLPQAIERKDLLVKIDHLGQTSMPGVFAGGDAVSNSRSVVEAIASGKRAALGIDLWLKGTDSKIIPILQKGDRGAILFSKYLANDYTVENNQVVPFSDLNTVYFTKAARVQGGELEVIKRSSNFLEVVSGISKTEAIREAERCFNCGHCNLCENCYIFCPEVAIRFDMEKSSFVIKSSELCRSCGICIEECPRSAIAWER